MPTKEKPSSAAALPVEVYRQAVDQADVALLIIDATVGVTAQDQRLAERIDAAGSPVVVLLNKHELLTDAEARADLDYQIAERLRFIGEAPVLVFGCLDHHVGGTGLAAGASVFPACQNLMMAARSFAVHSLFTTFFYLRRQEIKDILGIPPRIFMECAIFLGYAEEKLGKPKRLGVPEIAHLNGWDQPYQLAP